jgi:MOSC domain-containing protein YiiM
MPALKPTSLVAHVRFLGRVVTTDGLLHATPAPVLDLIFGGVAGEVHQGVTRASCSRVTALHPEGTPIANTRQLSILSVEDLAAIAADMGLDRLDPSLLGATLVVEGLADFTHLPPSSRLQAPSGATLVIDMENRPCTIPAKAIDAAHPGFGKRFKPAAQGRRGVTAWVEREGRLALGDPLKLFVPDQRAWSELGRARRG